MQEEQRLPCALAGDLQINILYDDGVRARLHRWPLLPVTWCLAPSCAASDASYAHMSHAGKAVYPRTTPTGVAYRPWPPAAASRRQRWPWLVRAYGYQGWSR